MRYNVLYKQRHLLFKIVDDMYMGRISNLIYKMISGHACGFELATLNNDEWVIDKFGFRMSGYMKMISNLNISNLEMKVVGVSPCYDTSADILPEYGNIVNAFNWYTDRETMSNLHDLLMTLLVCFNDFIFDVAVDSRDSNTLLCIINNNDELKLIIQE